MSQITPAVRCRDVADIPLFRRCYLAVISLFFRCNLPVFFGKKAVNSFGWREWLRKTSKTAGDRVRREAVECSDVNMLIARPECG
jgi:hypothetical protein